jgi:hypothetical protein
MFRTIFILAVVALNLNSLFADVFTAKEVRGHAASYFKSHPELEGKVHPAYAISHAYLGNVGEVLGSSADQALKEQAKQTAWKILTEGYGFGGFDEAKTASPLEAKFAFYSLRAIFSNDGYKYLSVPSSPDKPKVAGHLNLISDLLNVAKNVGSRVYTNNTEIPEVARGALQTWAAITNRGLESTNSSALLMYQQIFDAATTPAIGGGESSGGMPLSEDLTGVMSSGKANPGSSATPPVNPPLNVPDIKERAGVVSGSIADKKLNRPGADSIADKLNRPGEGSIADELNRSGEGSIKKMYEESLRYDQRWPMNHSLRYHLYNITRILRKLYPEFKITMKETWAPEIHPIIIESFGPKPTDKTIGIWGLANSDVDFGTASSEINFGILYEAQKNIGIETNSQRNVNIPIKQGTAYALEEKSRSCTRKIAQALKKLTRRALVELLGDEVNGVEALNLPSDDLMKYHIAGANPDLMPGFVWAPKEGVPPLTEYHDRVICFLMDNFPSELGAKSPTALFKEILDNLKDIS